MTVTELIAKLKEIAEKAGSGAEVKIMKAPTDLIFIVVENDEASYEVWDIGVEDCPEDYFDDEEKFG